MTIPSAADDVLFPGFASDIVATRDAEIHIRVGGTGPPLLMLHGYPQTGAAWHRIAPVLAQDYRVVVPDLRGYGRSVAIEPDAIASFGKDRMAQDQIAVMRSQGFDRFGVIGHDRGARVAYRLALDHPAAVSALVSITVIPTIEMWDQADKTFGMSAWHWFMLAQPFDLPERLIGAEPDRFLVHVLNQMAGDVGKLAGPALAEYRLAFRDPAVRHAICQDYRAAATIDAEQDMRDRSAGRKILCPLLVLWDSNRPDPPHGRTPLDI